MRDAQSLAKFTDGELAFLILKGKGRMPAYDGRENTDQIWALVNYIRSMPSGAGAAARQLGCQKNRSKVDSYSF